MENKPATACTALTAHNNALERNNAIFFVLKLAVITLALTIAAIALNLIYRSCLSTEYDGTASTGTTGAGYYSGGNYRVVVDAGHGGRDGGAVSITGTPEKTLNLEISLTLAELLRAVGIDAVETRTEDTVVGGEAPKGSRKMADLKARLAIAQSNTGALFVSIHMNKFPSAKYSGMQVWYSKNNEGSKVLAEYIRSSVVNLLQPDNSRQIKAAGSEIYLMDRVESPAVTVECGFISNPDEAAALETKQYRDKIAAVLLASVTGYCNRTEG
jgi:N-acetylmuramoyl-L-alanine amidase